VRLHPPKVRRISEPQRGLLTTFALRYILEAVDGANNVSTALLEQVGYMAQT
jgi:hypothetical protein